MRFTGECPDSWNIHQPERGFRKADEHFSPLLLLGWIEQTRCRFEGVLRGCPLSDCEEAASALDVQLESLCGRIRVRGDEIHRPQRHVVPMRCVLERQRRGRVITGSRGVFHSLIRTLVYGCLSKVVSELDNHRLEGGRLVLECGRNAMMKPHAAGGGDARIERLPDQRVREREIARCTGLFGHDVGREGFVHGVQYGVLTDIHERLDDRQPEFASHDRSDREKPLCRQVASFRLPARR